MLTAPDISTIRYLVNGLPARPGAPAPGSAGVTRAENGLAVAHLGRLTGRAELTGLLTRQGNTLSKPVYVGVPGSFNSEVPALAPSCPAAGVERLAHRLHRGQLTVPRLNHRGRQPGGRGPRRAIRSSCWCFAVDCAAAVKRMGKVEQLGFDGMPRRLYSCTPTRLGTWLDCPRRYRMTYLDRPAPPKGPPWAHNSFGASVHNALAGWWRLPPRQRTTAAAGELLDRGWLGDGFADDAQSAAYRHRARVMIEAYVSRLDPASEPLGVERTVATRTETIAFSGRIDRLDDRRDPLRPGDSGELVVVDYKTGRHVLTADDARTSLPLALYALAAERVMRRPCRRVELHHLPTGRVLGWEHSAESLQRQLGRAEQIAAECAEADQRFRAGGTTGQDSFAPRPGSWCGWCDYRGKCPEGAAAAPARRPWDGLEPIAAAADGVAGDAAMSGHAAVAGAAAPGMAGQPER